MTYSYDLTTMSLTFSILDMIVNNIFIIVFDGKNEIIFLFSFNFTHTIFIIVFIN